MTSLLWISVVNLTVVLRVCNLSQFKVLRSIMPMSAAIKLHRAFGTGVPSQV